MASINKRASNPEQKALRRKQILQSARHRFDTSAFENVNLSHIAKDVGITKAALYRYFRNKETLFLALFVDTLDEIILSAESEVVRRDLATAIVNTLLQNPTYCKLSSILHTVLECNLSVEEAVKFKKTLLNLMGRYAQMVVQNSVLTPQQAVNLLFQVQHALIGCWHMSHPSGAVAEAIEGNGLQVFKHNFDEILFEHVSRLVQSYGLE